MTDFAKPGVSTLVDAVPQRVKERGTERGETAREGVWRKGARDRQSARWRVREEIDKGRE